MEFVTMLTKSFLSKSAWKFCIELNRAYFFHEQLKWDTKGSHHTLERKKEFGGLNEPLKVLVGYQTERGLDGFYSLEPQERAEF